MTLTLPRIAPTVIGAALLCAATLPAQASCITYTTTVVTGDTSGAGTDANIKITFVGTKATYETKANTFIDHDAFERGSTDTYSRCLNEDMGKPLMLFIDSDNAYPGSDWFLSEVTITSDDPKARHLGIFTINQWVTEDNALVAVPCQYCRWSPDTRLTGIGFSETVQERVDGTWREIEFEGTGDTFGG